MKSLVIYDSYFGNTKRVAKAIAKQLNTTAVDVKSFRNEWLEDLELLVLGSPTRAFRPTDRMKNFINTLPSLDGIKVATFDTRIEMTEESPLILKFFVKIFGYAAEPILKRLEKRGAKSIREPMGFYVEDTEGPLREGEIKRAKVWISD